MDEQLPSEQKARLHVVANLMLEIYQTLAEMRYLDAAGIEQGPHIIDHLRPMGRSNKESKNPMSIEPIPSHRAGDVLRDIVRWYRSLDELPGVDHCGDEWSRDLPLKELYREYGWPENFDGDGFQVAQARAHCASSAKSTTEEPLRKVETCKRWRKLAETRISAHQAELAAAKSTDEEWAVRFKLWREEIWSARNIKWLTEAEQEAERLCPGGLCQRKEDLSLWELERLRNEYKCKQESVETYRNWAEECVDTDPDRARYYQISLQQAKREAAIYQKAYEAAQADAERLCPGKAFQSATGMASLVRTDTVTSIRDQKHTLAMMQAELEALRVWALQLPDGAIQAKKLVEEEVQQYERRIKDGKEMLQRDEAYLAEHGNQD